MGVRGETEDPRIGRAVVERTMGPNCGVQVWGLGFGVVGFRVQVAGVGVQG